MKMHCLQQADILQCALQAPHSPCLPANIFGHICCDLDLRVSGYRRASLCDDFAADGHLSLRNPGLDDVPAVFRVLLQTYLIQAPLFKLGQKTKGICAMMTSEL